MHIRQLLRNAKVDSIVKRGSHIPLLLRTNLRKITVSLIEGTNAIHDRRSRRGQITDQPKMIPKTNRKRLIIRLQHLVQKRLNVLLMFLNELVLTPALIDDQPDAQRKLVVMREETNLLGHSILNNREVALG